MHDPEYTKKIKALLAARESLDLNMNSAVYQFRNGRKPYPEHVEAMKKAFNEAMAILEFREEQEDRDTRRARALERAQQEDGRFDTPEQRKAWLQSFGKEEQDKEQD